MGEKKKPDKELPPPKEGALTDVVKMMTTLDVEIMLSAKKRRKE